MKSKIYSMIMVICMMVILGAITLQCKPPKNDNPANLRKVTEAIAKQFISGYEMKQLEGSGTKSITFEKEHMDIIREMMKGNHGISSLRIDFGIDSSGVPVCLFYAPPTDNKSSGDKDFYVAGTPVKLCPPVCDSLQDKQSMIPE